MKSLKDITVAGKNVLIRVDFNVPLADEDGEKRITDDTRIRYVVPTLQYLIDQQAKVIVCSHLGRPKGAPDPAFSLKPAAVRLGELLAKPVTITEDCVGGDVRATIEKMQPGDVVVLENLRFHPGEGKNDDDFAASLGALCEVYVNDAFAVSHRSNASVDAITRHVTECAAGFLLEKEIATFQKAMENPERPLAALVGGAKVSSKLGAFYNMIEVVDSLLIGGAMANTFLKAKGMDVGISKTEDDLLEEAAKILEKAAARNVALELPVDVIVAEKIDEQAATSTVPVDRIPAGHMALDIGPETCRQFSDILKNARTVVWNGPMGIFEMPLFAEGTKAMASALAQSSAFTVVGGGDTVSAVHMAEVADKMSYISTGGGAFLELMEGKTLPGVAALG
ncbi:MAG: phosphoglycerate kinase [Thermodesulfobacteriota bacterium]|nr:phosphoglycerate kinase [Thermodesulfobacteriota bacterium]